MEGHFFLLINSNERLNLGLMEKEPIGQESDSPEMDLIIKEHHFGILELDSMRFSWRVYGLDGQELDSLLVDKVE
jgi:hypothetical protein